MRRIEYSVACSLDGYIAGPAGEYDWIPMDPEIDFGALMGRYDTYLMGRRTYEMTQGAGGPAAAGRVLVFSRTLQPEDHPDVTIVAEDAEERLRELRAQPGKDIWLFGGGELFRSLLELNQVDALSIAVVPVLLGGGVPLLPSPAARARLELTNHRVYRRTGIVALDYSVDRRAATRPVGRKRARGKAAQ